MQWLSILCLISVLACSTTPDATPSAGRASSLQSGTAAEFADAGAGFGAEFGTLEPSGDLRGNLAMARAVRLAAAPSAGEAVRSTEVHPDAPAREVVYTADLRLIVVSIAAAIVEVKEIAEAEGGHLDRSTASSIAVRVPARRFEPVIARIEALGEIVGRSVVASDVTEEVFDLDIRLENARKARERLVAHLAQSRKISDTLKIEAELTRVTETIEQLEGRLRLLRSQVAFSTIRVDFSARLPEPTTSASPLGLPFGWIEELGDGLLAGQVEATTREPGVFRSGPRFEPPADFVRYFTSRDRVEALSADGVRIKVRREANHDKGALGFWSELARDGLVRTRGLAVAEERSLGDDRALIVGTREVARGQLGYLLVLVRTPRDVYAFEAWGPKEAFDAHRGALEQSAKSLRR